MSEAAWELREVKETVWKTEELGEKAKIARNKVDLKVLRISKQEGFALRIFEAKGKQLRRDLGVERETAEAETSENKSESRVKIVSTLELSSLVVCGLPSHQ